MCVVQANIAALTASRVQWVSVYSVYHNDHYAHDIRLSHIHVSLRNKEGRNIFAVSDSELKTGRENAAYKDTKFISQEAEWFLAGVLDGIADGDLTRADSSV